ncbi:hypothetical protein WJX73_009313 [Symbiochloris irregularis]|uniref:Uncharacterized protein n=1 Tax=Symbiochloris irregularis TaxID=706552 RepID=A0AAW1P5N1_9CHLO
MGKLTPEQLAGLKKAHEEDQAAMLSKEELEGWAHARLNEYNLKQYQDKLREAIRNHKVPYQGRKVPMIKLMEKVAKEEKTLAVGGYDPGVRGKHEEGHLEEDLLPEERRPGAYKHVLTPDEEELLKLDLFGRGVDMVPQKVLGLWTRAERQYSFGIYGRQSNARVLMCDKWAGKDPALVLDNQQFYDDLMRQAAGMELTIMAHPVKDLELGPMLNDVLQRLYMNMALRAPRLVIEDADLPDGKEANAGKDPAAAGTPVTAEQKQALTQAWEGTLQQSAKEALNELARDFSPERLRLLGMVDNNYRVKAGSHWIFTWGPYGELIGEGITHHKLRDRKTVSLGIWPYPQLTQAVFDTFLGHRPVDATGKRLAGQGVLYVANGFRFEDKPDNERLFYEGPDGQPMVLDEALIPYPQQWDLVQDARDGPMPRLLLNTARSRAVGYCAVRKPGVTSRIGSLFGRLRRR